jgi:hypothetical protein
MSQCGSIVIVGVATTRWVEQVATGEAKRQRDCERPHPFALQFFSHKASPENFIPLLRTIK